jgi:hypothetical protein
LQPSAEQTLRLTLMAAGSRPDYVAATMSCRQAALGSIAALDELARGPLAPDANSGVARNDLPSAVSDNLGQSLGGHHDDAAFDLSVQLSHFVRCEPAARLIQLREP